MRLAYDTTAVYAAEADLMSRVPEGSLMATAAAGVARVVRDLLAPDGLAGRRVVLLVGSGNNGGDALYAGVLLARRGLTVTAVTTADSWHDAGARALLRAGGRLVPATAAAEVVGGADVVVDGIVGIGATGPVRPPAVGLLAAIPATAWVVAVDIPSGVDPSTGAVADPAAVVTADVTVTFGVFKAGQILAPGRDRCGVVELVDIGLGPAAARQPETCGVLTVADARPYFAAPAVEDYKYSHGVPGVVAGCPQYPGAPHMVVGAARHSGVGMVRLWQDPAAPAVAAAVVQRFPDTVCTDSITDAKVTGWAIGPGMGTGSGARDRLAEVLAADLPAVVDADALTLLAGDPELRRMLGDRTAPTALTPHVGEFARLGYEVGDDRLAAARAAAADLGATLLLKGPGTVIADPDGTAFVDVMATSALATAGSGDSLTGIIGAVLSRRPPATAEAVAAAVLVHGLAGRLASAGERPMTAWDLVGAVPDAVADVRRT